MAALIEKYRRLEEEVRRETVRVLDDVVDPVATVAESLLRAEDFTGARAVIESMVVDPDQREALSRGFRPLVFDALVLGGRRLVPARQTLAARQFIDAALTDAVVEQYVTMVSEVMVPKLKDRLFGFVERAEALARRQDEQTVTRSDEVGRVLKALTVDQIASRLNNAAFNGKPALASVSANLATSRLTQYGFLAQARAEGVTRFQITEILDNLTCPVCWRTHGQIYDVDPAFSHLDNTLRTTDPDALKQLAPWPDQSTAGLQLYDGMSSAERAEAGYDKPPFHPYCRDQLVPVGTTDPVPVDQYPDDVPRPGVEDVELPDQDDLAASARSALQEVGGEDFADRGFSDKFGTDLRDLSAQMFVPFHRRGWRVTSAETRRLGERAQWRLSIDAVNEAGERMQMNRAFGVGSGRFGTREGVFTVNHASLVLPASETGTGIGREVLRNSVRAYRAVDPRTSVELIANIDVGNYAWARYGFKPTAVQPSLRNELRERLEDLDVPSDVRAAAEEVIASDDKRLLWHLADMRYDVGGVPLGRRLLSGKGFSWPGRLDLDDAEAMERFEAYVGRTSGG